MLVRRRDKTAGWGGAPPQPARVLGRRLGAKRLIISLTSAYGAAPSHPALASLHPSIAELPKVPATHV